MTTTEEVARATTPNETVRVAESLAGLLEPVDSLAYLPGNPRRGDVGAIARSLATFGQRKPVVARRGDRAVIAGNHTLEARHILVWVKDRPTFSLGRLDYEYQHEPICYGWTPGAAHRWYAESSRSSIIQVDRPSASKIHPTMKPAAVYEHLIRNSAPPGGIVLDPFAGSGTVVAACHQTGRRARSLELDPHYCDVICARYEALTGTVPVLERTGAPHAFT